MRARARAEALAPPRGPRAALARGAGRRAPRASSAACTDADRRRGASALEERIPLRGMRKRIFENMARSKHTAAHFTFVEECDVDRAQGRCASASSRRAEKRGVKLTYLPFIVKAVVAALKKHPIAQQRLRRGDAGDRRRARYYHIGIAAATDAGLIVPVVRDADRTSMLDIAREIERLGERRARPAR